MPEDPAPMISKSTADVFSDAFGMSTLRVLR